jgi:GR25 family glycosyltransferase involved in LPS biosynthesis
MSNVIVGSNDMFLNRYFLEPKFLELITPVLSFIDDVPKVPTDSKAIVARRTAATMLTDTEKRKPRRTSTGAQFKTVKISEIETITSIVKKSGFMVEISDDARRWPEGIDEVNRALTTISYWMAEDLAGNVASTLKSDVYNVQDIDASETTHYDAFYHHINDGSHKTWGEAGCNPVTDIAKLRQTFIRRDKPFMLTDVFVDSENFHELINYLVNINTATDAQKQAIWLEKDATSPVVTIPVLNTKIHLVRSGLDAGSILGADMNNSPVTYYYASNPLFPQTRTNPYGIHVYTEDDRMNEIFRLKIWAEYALSVLEPYAGIYSSTGI